MKKIKKFFAILLITVLSVSTVVFADDMETYDDNTFIQNAESILKNDFVDISYDDCLYYIENQIGMVQDAFESYLPFLEENKMGGFINFAGTKVDRSEDGIVTCEITMAYENGQIKCTINYKSILGNPTPIKISFSSTDTEENKSLGSRMADAGLNTLIGIFTVVAILVIIMFFIMLFRFIPVLEKKFTNGKKNNSTEIAVDNAITQITETEELVDDYELVAVVTAAIAASTGSSSDGFVVRSIRKAKRSR